MGAMHGQSEGFLSVSMPNTFSMGWDYVKSYIEKHNLKRPNRNAFNVIRKRVERTLELGIMPGESAAFFGDARDVGNLKAVNSQPVKLIFSSPPYLKVIKYGLYNWIRLWWLVGTHEDVDDRLDDGHSLEPYLEFMDEILRIMLPLMDRDSGLACWVIGDVGNLNLAKTVWEEVGSKIELLTSEGEILRYKLLDIIADEIPSSEKTTRIWDSEESGSKKSGKATEVDRILMICPEFSSPEALISNRQIVWNRFEC